MAKLYVLASPIGNLEDISLRALRVLKEGVNTIYCEDTRLSSKLLNHYEISGKKLNSFNKESEQGKTKLLINDLNEGKDLVLMSDAGTPLISDPGSFLLQEIKETEHELVPIPGASSLTAALSICPLDFSGFIFEGFLPHGPKQRRRILRAIDEEGHKRALVFFESPHRIFKTLEDIANIFGEETEIFIARELTKKFEQSYCSKVTDLIAELKEQFPDNVQGEMVLVVKRSN